MDSKLILDFLETSDEVTSDAPFHSSSPDSLFANMPLKRKNYILNVTAAKQMIEVKPHTRLTDIPLHSHSYIEMMYVYEGTVIHFIDEKTIPLEKGELLLMNRHTKHSIPASGSKDIGINFLISNDFLQYAAGSLRSSKILSDFADNSLSDTGESRFLIYKIGGRDSIESLIENLIRYSLIEKDTPQIILSDTMSLIFRYLQTFPEMLIYSSFEAVSEKTKAETIVEYIQTHYRTASLTELAEQLNITPPYLSKLTKQLFGVPFSELLKKQRFNEAARLLSESDISVIKISEAVGYENNSFFHKRFKEQFGMTPAKWKKATKSRSS